MCHPYPQTYITHCPQRVNNKERSHLVYGETGWIVMAHSTPQIGTEVCLSLKNTKLTKENKHKNKNKIIKQRNKKDMLWGASYEC